MNTTSSSVTAPTVRIAISMTGTRASTEANWYDRQTDIELCRRFEWRCMNWLPIYSIWVSAPSISTYKQTKNTSKPKGCMVAGVVNCMIISPTTIDMIILTAMSL